MNTILQHNQESYEMNELTVSKWIVKKCNEYLVKYSYKNFLHTNSTEFTLCIYLFQTASVVQWSEFLATDPGVSGSFTGATRISKK
jgi:hypothetical protein